MYSKKIRRKEFLVASSFKHLTNLFNIFSSSRMFYFCCLVVTPAYSARLGKVFLISSGFSTLEIQFRGQEVFEQINMYIERVEFCYVSSFFSAVFELTSRTQARDDFWFSKTLASTFDCDEGWKKKITVLKLLIRV